MLQSAQIDKNRIVGKHFRGLVIGPETAAAPCMGLAPPRARRSEQGPRQSEGRWTIGSISLQ
jgi:hypothetical protein